MATPSTGAVSTPNKKPSLEHFQEIVTIIVGREKKAYNLHTDLLCFYSDYFRAAFNGSFKEAEERKLELPTVRTALFDAFHLWLYTRDLQPFDCTKEFQFLANMWIFGDQYQIPLLQNQAIDRIFARSAESESFTFSVVPSVYAKTVPGSPLRKAVIEIIAYTMGLEEFDKSPNTGDWTTECLKDLVVAVYQARMSEEVTSPDLPGREKCFFHVHGKDEHC